MSRFQHLKESGNSMFVTSPKKFIDSGTINEYSITSLKWAYDNAYKGHFKNASRDRFKTMLDAFLGKIGEFAVYQFFKDLNYNIELPETILRHKGEWDDGDLVVESQKVQVKTTTYNSNFLLVKKSDWDSEGNYLWGREGKDPKYGAFFLCRIKPDPRKIFLQESSIDKLLGLCENVSWRYEITGFATKKDFIEAMRDRYIIPKGKYLNGKIQVREDLIYFQAGDLRNPGSIPKKKADE